MLFEKDSKMRTANKLLSEKTSLVSECPHMT